MRPRLLATATQLSCDAMANRDRRAPSAMRKSKMATGFAVCPETQAQLCFVPRPAPCITLNVCLENGMTQTRIWTLANTASTSC